jgi:hypothetical protein
MSNELTTRELAALTQIIRDKGYPTGEVSAALSGRAWGCYKAVSSDDRNKYHFFYFYATDDDFLCTRDACTPFYQACKDDFKLFLAARRKRLAKADLCA